MSSKTGTEVGRRRRRLSGLLWLFAGVACVMAGSRGWRVVRRWQVARAIVRFEARPSQSGADKLIWLLSKEAATDDQGRRGLELLLGPKVTTRAAYPVGKTAKVAVGVPFLLNVPNGRIEMRRSVWWEGRRQVNWPARTTSTLRAFPELLAAGTGAKEPGRYDGEIRYECRLTRRRGGSSFWTRLRDRLRGRVLRRWFRPSRVSFEETYACQFTLPLAVNIVEAGEAEKLEVVSDRQLDEAVRGAFTTRPVKTHSVYWTDSGRRHCVGSTELLCRPLPVGIAFEMSLRLPDGRKLPKDDIHPRQRIRLRAGTAGRFTVEPGPFGIAGPGKYSGMLVLRPDPDHAYEDPAIKAIWDGTLELPVSFTVSEEPNVP